MKYPYFLLFAALTVFVPKAIIWAGPSDHRPPAVAIVTTTHDNGTGSLRAAIESANKNAGTRIVFRIPATDKGFVRSNANDSSWRIVPSSPLPMLRKPNTRLEGGGRIVIAGDKVGTGGSGLRVEATRCQIVGMGWSKWPDTAISIRASRIFVQRNKFESGTTGIAVHGSKSRGNRFEGNTFDGMKKPIALWDGSNDAIVAPELKIARDDAISPVSHKFTIQFAGKPKADVTLELNYSADEARELANVQKVSETRTVKTDAQGHATWQFDRKGYPVGSWTVTATQNGSTSAFSNVVVLPYL
ncbi:hypothetical protein EON83_16725 [bacterium]|nr:MAG: hypothetical protein EON83_16725 [bacterium]